ncbi:MAG: hypothetical protein H0T79_14860 [Deltaproteobacteria bacterium]|nr:hypothetical protein [Deltaproteobacteria bacterium]
MWFVFVRSRGHGAMFGILHGAGLLTALPFVFAGSKRIWNPAIPMVRDVYTTHSTIYNGERQIEHRKAVHQDDPLHPRERDPVHVARPRHLHRGRRGKQPGHGPTAGPPGAATGSGPPRGDARRAMSRLTTRGRGPG